MKQFPFRIGAIVSKPKFPFVNHVGIVVGYDAIAHAEPLRGARITSLAEFEGDQKATFVRMAENPAQAIRIALDLVQRGYSWRLFDSNCEHFIALCEGKRPESPQLAGAAMVTLLITAVALIGRG